MPISSFGLARLWLASGLLILATFTSARAQETPVDPNYQDIPLHQEDGTGFQPVSPLAHPEIDEPNCAPAPAAWHPPILYPKPEVCCPTGVVHRDWWREKTTGHWLNFRQRMLEKDYAWRVQNGHQPTCCPPHSCWGHYCDECPGIGCKERRHWWGFGKDRCDRCGRECEVHEGCQTHGNATPALSPMDSEADLLEPSPVQVQPLELGHFEAMPLECHPSLAEFLDSDASGIELTDHVADGGDAGKIQLISDERLFAEEESGIDTAGFYEVSDRCASDNGPAYHSGLGPGYYGPPHFYGEGWEECEEDHCDCHICRLKRCFCDCFCHYLHGDGLGGPYDPYGRGAYGPNGIVRGVGGRGGWRREIPPFGQYYLAYPENPYHFDQRDGRIYGAQGYGHAVGVPLAPNVEHTYNYGWGLPSSRLSPVSRMPGAPGVANPPVPSAAGPGVYPPGFANPLPGGFGR